MSKKTLSVRSIPVTKLFVDAALTGGYQRRCDEGDVSNIVENYVPALFRHLEVSARPGGSYALIDGQHRWAAAVQLGLKAVPCRVHVGLTKKEEAELFLQFDEGVASIGAYDRFLASVKAGRRIQVEVKRIVGEAGLTVDLSRKERSISAVKALELVHTKYDTLARTLQILTAWQNGHQSAYDGTFIRYVGALLALHPGADDARCVKVLRDVSPRELKRHVKEVRADLGCSRAKAAVYSLRALYNHRLARKRKLLGEVSA